jgi:hypothetical protein
MSKSCAHNDYASFYFKLKGIVGGLTLPLFNLPHVAGWRWCSGTCHLSLEWEFLVFWARRLRSIIFQGVRLYWESFKLECHPINRKRFLYFVLTFLGSHVPVTYHDVPIMFTYVLILFRDFSLVIPMFLFEFPCCSYTRLCRAAY